MWVERIQVAGFKRLDGVFEFDSALTLVLGPNEAGKSSLGEALVRSIWGFERTERRRRERISPWERCRPWGGSPWRIIASLVDHDGRRLRAEWDFDEHTVRLLDAVTGEDLSSQVVEKRGDVSLGTFLTGVSFADFSDVCRFDQHTLAAVQRSDSLENALQHSVEAVEAEGGVSDTDARLKDFLNASIGARSDTYSLLPSGPLQRDLNERAAIGALIESAQEEEAELARLAQELHRRELQHVVLAEEALEIERAILTHELTEAQGIGDEVIRQQERAAEVLDEGEQLDDRAVNNARESFGATDHADRAIDELSRVIADAKPEIDHLRSLERQLSDEMDALKPAADIDRSGEAAVRDALAALRQVEGQPPAPAPAVPEVDPALARYRDLRGELLGLAGQVEVRWLPARIGVALAIVVISIALGVLVSPVALTGLGLAAMAAATARAVDTGASLTVRLREEFGGESLDDLERRARHEDEVIGAARAAAEAANTACAARESSRTEIAARLTRALDAVGAAQGPVLTRAETYLEACRQYGDLQDRGSRLNDIQRRLAHLTEPEREIESRRTAREERRSSLLATLTTLGIDGSDLDSARTALDDLVRANSTLAQQRAEASGAQQALGALLAKRQPDEIFAELQEAESRLQEHAREHPTVTAADGDLTALRPRLAETQRRLADAAQLAAALRAQIGEREARLPNVPALREQLVALDERIESRQLALEAIQIARSGLKEAARQAHRNFAPHLQRALERTLPRLTANRYRDVTIADDLSLSVVSPETGRQVPADCLSYGTQDQIYLVQRLEIAKLLIPTSGPVPLLLDEPFAEFDADRERSAVELLWQESEQRQIVVFTKDRRLVDLFAEVGREPHVIELSAPTAAVLST